MTKKPKANKQLTVKELIAALKKMPPDALVITEGCDCIGEATYVEISGPDHVCIRRAY